MNKGTFSIKGNKALRFRRWSRKASAVFHSLHSAVGIGCLSTSVVSSLEKKTAKISKLLGANTQNTFVNKIDETEESIAFASLSLGVLCQLLGIIFTTNTLCLEGQKPYSALRHTIIKKKANYIFTSSLLSLFTY